MLQIWILLTYRKKRKIFMGYEKNIHLKSESLSLEGNFQNWIGRPQKEFTKGKKESDQNKTWKWEIRFQCRELRAEGAMRGRFDSSIIQAVSTTCL